MRPRSAYWKRRVPVTGALVLCFCTAVCLCLVWARSLVLPGRPGAPMGPSEYLRPPAPLQAPCEAARQTAAQQCTLARAAVGRQLEALEAWDPTATEGSQGEALRHHLLARDAGHFLGRAREAAKQAQSLARTRREAYRATLLRVYIEHDTGHHGSELQQACRLIKLGPGDPIAESLLRRALKCGRRKAWAGGSRPCADQ
jgi:hypothetical protein